MLKRFLLHVFCWKWILLWGFRSIVRHESATLIPHTLQGIFKQNLIFIRFRGGRLPLFCCPFVASATLCFLAKSCRTSLVIIARETISPASPWRQCGGREISGVRGLRAPPIVVIHHVNLSRKESGFAVLDCRQSWTIVWWSRHAEGNFAAIMPTICIYPEAPIAYLHLGRTDGFHEKGTKSIRYSVASAPFRNLQ